MESAKSTSRWPGNPNPHSPRALACRRRTANIPSATWLPHSHMVAPVCGASGIRPTQICRSRIADVTRPLVLRPNLAAGLPLSRMMTPQALVSRKLRFAQKVGQAFEPDDRQVLPGRKSLTYGPGEESYAAHALASTCQGADVEHVMPPPKPYVTQRQSQTTNLKGTQKSPFVTDLARHGANISYHR